MPGRLWKIEYSMSALPSGYLVSSARDMTHYLMAFINGGRYGKSMVYTENLITEVQTSIGNTSYGAGWFSAGHYKWHTGEVANYNAYICTVLSENLGIIVLSNTNDIGVKYLNRECSSLTRIHNGIEADYFLLYSEGLMPYSFLNIFEKLNVSL